MRLPKNPSDKLNLTIRRAKAAELLAIRVRRRLEKVEHELELSHQFGLDINACNSIDEILKVSRDAMQSRYGIDGSFLTLVDPSRERLFVYKIGPRPEHFNDQMSAYVANITLPLDESSGLVYQVYKRQRPFYMAKVKDKFWSKFNNDIIKKLQITSFFILPLMARGEVFAVAFFTSFHGYIKLLPSDISVITRFATNVAGLIHTNYLLEQISIQKQAALDSRNETIRLNDFSREINTLYNLDDILERIAEYLKIFFNLKKIIILLKNQADDHFYTAWYTPTLQQSVFFLDTLHFDPSKTNGLPASATSSNLPIIISAITDQQKQEDESKILQTLDTESALFLPIKIYNRSLGLVIAFNFAENFSAQDVKIQRLERFCNQIPGPIQNALLLKEVDRQRNLSDNLLKAILPGRIADLLKANKKVTPRLHDEISIMFTDFFGFTSIAALLKPEQLLTQLEKYFDKFDDLCSNFNVTRIKTMGDGYMAASGLIGYRASHAVDITLAALQLSRLVHKEFADLKSKQPWQLRIGLHCGPVVSGILGRERYQFDIWGDTVNTASRMESFGEAGKINVSKAFYKKVEHFFTSEEKRKAEVKAKGKMTMFYISGIRPELSENMAGIYPNDLFQESYQKYFKTPWTFKY